MGRDILPIRDYYFWLSSLNLLFLVKFLFISSSSSDSTKFSIFNNPYYIPPILNPPPPILKQPPILKPSPILLNIMSKFIPNEIKRMVPRDPPWITKSLKAMLNRKNKLYKNYKRHGYQDDDKIRLEAFRKE